MKEGEKGESRQGPHLAIANIVKAEKCHVSPLEAVNDLKYDSSLETAASRRREDKELDYDCASSVLLSRSNYCSRKQHEEA